MVIMPLPDLATRKTDITARLCNLPRFQPAAVRLLSVSTDSDSALEEFESIFRTDPALASEVLQRANSAEFALHGRVSDIRNALVFIGLERTRALAVTICMSLYAGKTGRGGDTRPIWLHSVATATVAERLASRAGRRSLTAYTAGLMHDVGRLGLLASCGAEYGQILSRPFRDLDEANEVERIAFGMTHAEAGSFLARSWNFPQGLCDSILQHHCGASGDTGDQSALVRSACAMATHLGYPEVEETEAAPLEVPRGMDLELLRTLIEANTSDY
jgi:HD-like signal output (HDOD) protein